MFEKDMSINNQKHAVQINHLFAIGSKSSVYFFSSNYQYGDSKEIKKKWPDLVIQINPLLYLYK